MHRRGKRTVVSSDWKQGLPVLAPARCDAARAARSRMRRRSSRCSRPKKCRASFRRRRRRSRDSSGSSPGRTPSARPARYACFAVVPDGIDTAIGIFQVRAARTGVRDRRVGLRDRIAVLGHGRCSRRARSWCSTSPSTHRGASARGTRGGAERTRQWRAAQDRRACEGVLRKSFLSNGEYLDQNLWSILAEDSMTLRRSVRVGSSIH